MFTDSARPISVILTVPEGEALVVAKTTSPGRERLMRSTEVVPDEPDKHIADAQKALVEAVAQVVDADPKDKGWVISLQNETVLPVREAVLTIEGILYTGRTNSGDSVSLQALASNLQAHSDENVRKAAQSVSDELSVLRPSLSQSVAGLEKIDKAGLGSKPLDEASVGETSSVFRTALNPRMAQVTATFAPGLKEATPLLAAVNDLQARSVSTPLARLGENGRGSEAEALLKSVFADTRPLDAALDEHGALTLAIAKLAQVIPEESPESEQLRQQVKQLAEVQRNFNSRRIALPTAADEFAQHQRNLGLTLTQLNQSLNATKSLLTEEESKA